MIFVSLFWLFCYNRTLSLCPFKFLASSLFISMCPLCLVFFLFCVSLLNGDKQGFKFRGVMSIFYTHFILMFLCVFVFLCFLL